MADECHRLFHKLDLDGTSWLAGKMEASIAFVASRVFIASAMHSLRYCGIDDGNTTMGMRSSPKLRAVLGTDPRRQQASKMQVDEKVQETFPGLETFACFVSVKVVYCMVSKPHDLV